MVDLAQFRTVALDTSVLIYHLEGHPHFGPAAHQVFKLVDARQLQAVVSVLALTELLVKPLAEGNQAQVAQHRAFVLGTKGLEAVAVDAKIAEAAARLRGRYLGLWSLRTPDAIHIATGIAFKAEVFITSDRLLVRLAELPVVLLEDVLVSEG